MNKIKYIVHVIEKLRQENKEWLHEYRTFGIASRELGSLLPPRGTDAALLSAKKAIRVQADGAGARLGGPVG